MKETFSLVGKRPEMMFKVGDISQPLSIYYTDGYKSVDMTHPWEVPWCCI